MTKFTLKVIKEELKRLDDEYERLWDEGINTSKFYKLEKQIESSYFLSKEARDRIIIDLEEDKQKFLKKERERLNEKIEDIKKQIDKIKSGDYSELKKREGMNNSVNSLNHE